MPPEVVVDDGTVVGRALAVIDAVAEYGANVTLAQLATATGIPKPTVFRITASLIARDLLKRTKRGYALGPGLSRLGEKASLQIEFERYIPVLEELHASHGGVAWVTAGRDFLDVQPVVQVCDPEFVLVARNGWPVPGSAEMLANTAGGHLVLAHQPALFDRIARSEFMPTAPNASATHNSCTRACNGLAARDLPPNPSRASRDGVAWSRSCQAPPTDSP